MKIQVVKHIGNLKINVEIHSKEPNNDFQCLVFEDETKLPTSPGVTFF